MTAVRFERELEVFRTEIDAATQFFHAYLAVHNVASESKPVFRLLNKAPLFWNTSLGALQTAAFIALGRVFDQDSAHNLDRLLGLAQKNLPIFSGAALARRKQGGLSSPPAWLDDYLLDVYVPTSKDFRSMRKLVKAWRGIYESNYRDLRHKFFAHKEVSNQTDIDALFAKTNIGELQNLFGFLSLLHKALWELFFNGREPGDFSATVVPTVQARITDEAERFLLTAAGVTRPDA